jgi:hypothetical protein
MTPERFSSHLPLEPHRSAIQGTQFHSHKNVLLWHVVAVSQSNPAIIFPLAKLTAKRGWPLKDLLRCVMTWDEGLSSNLLSRASWSLIPPALTFLGIGYSFEWQPQIDEKRTKLFFKQWLLWSCFRMRMRALYNLCNLILKDAHAPRIRNFPCQTLKISKVSIVVMGS